MHGVQIKEYEIKTGKETIYKSLLEASLEVGYSPQKIKRLIVQEKTQDGSRFYLIGEKAKETIEAWKTANLGGGRVFPTWAIEYIKRHYSTQKSTEIAQAINAACGTNLTATQVTNKIRYLGLNTPKGIEDSHILNNLEKQKKTAIERRKRIKIGVLIIAKKFIEYTNYQYTLQQVRVIGVYKNFVRGQYKKKIESRTGDKYIIEYINVPYADIKKVL